MIYSILNEKLQQNKLIFDENSSYVKIVKELENLCLKLNSHSKIFSILKANPKGFYIYGTTGSGKTTLMNAFFSALDVPKMNIHFHDYFLDITKLLTKYSMQKLVEKLARKVKVLCFDEFFIESIADARLLKDLFEGLIKKGVIIVATSNFEPEKLYENGFNREVIFPDFSNFLRANLQVFNLSHLFDFRLQKNHKQSIIKTEIPDFFVPQKLEIEGHIISCKTFQHEAIFEFNELFAKPRSVVLFIDICRKFDKIYIANFKPFSEKNEDEAIRFRNFIDVAYIRHNQIFLQTTIEESQIFEAKMLENIKIKRTYSRLREMSQDEFLSSENLLKRKWQTEARKTLSSL